uniref:Uncharacterized protein n=1 Tax=Panagrolaimus sp. ES5 TaxID=591445 RepID=A0AC34FF36_9BILA
MLISTANSLWAEWVQMTTCADTCGSCGVVIKQRSCATDPCLGVSVKYELCNIQPCKYPRNSCCAPYKAMSYLGQIICGPLPPGMDGVTLPVTTPCCPIGGVWSTWIQTTKCTDNCGSCAQITKTRTCLSAADGCPCIGDSTKLEYCGTSPCKYPRNSCCGTFKAMSQNGIIVCGPLIVLPDVIPIIPWTCCPTNGVWSSWEEWSTCQGTCNQCGTASRKRICISENNGCPCVGDSTESKQCKVIGIWNDWVIQKQCNDTCGACGSMTYTRTCQPGCACVGAETKTEACGFKLCTYPRTSCCAGFIRGSYQGLMQCGPLPITDAENTLLACTTDPAGPPVYTCLETTCSDTCGLCGSMVQARATTCGSVRCADPLCTFPRTSCCPVVSKRGIAGGKIKCIPI